VAQYKLANTAVKVAIDQTMGAPLYIYSYYCITNLAAAAIADHDSDSESTDNSNLQFMAVATDVHQKAASMLLPTMLQHWKLWPAVHTLNFYFVPLPHRVLVQNTVLVGWSGYLSHLNHAPQQQAKLMTPDQEIKAALVRRDTQIKLQQQQQEQQLKTKQQPTSATTTTTRTIITE